MKKFKIFHSSHDKSVDDYANEWLEQNPDVVIVDFKYARKQGAYDGICILYEELEKFEDVPILFCKDIIEGTNNAIFECPKCSSKYEYPAFLIGSDIRCKKCELNFGRKKNP